MALAGITALRIQHNENDKRNKVDACDRMHRLHGV
jgi:hypothetical protein